MWSWIATVSAAVVRFTVLHPVATIVTGIVSIAAGAWIQEQEWVGHELVAGLLYGVGATILKVGVVSYAAGKAWEAAGEVLRAVLKPYGIHTPGFYVVR